MDGTLSYNANSLQTFDRMAKVGINTNLISHTDMPDSNGQIFALADADDSNVPADNYISRTISLGGTIHGSTQSDLDTRIDAFKGYFAVRNKNLDITYNGGTRRYVVMRKNKLSITRDARNLYATFTLDLICKPFGKDITTTDIINVTGYTSATKTQAFTVGGSADYQLPVSTITINAVTGTGDYIQLSNDQNSQGMTITGLGLKAGDVLVIDAEQRIVTKNGTKVDYAGTFIALPAGSASITYTDGFTTRNVDIHVVYTKRYM